MLSLLVSILTILAPKLPIMNNIYKTSINFSVLGNQNIEYQRIEKYKSIEGVSGVHLMGYKQEEDIASVISHFK